MNAAEFDTQFNRLASHFHLPVDSTRESLVMDWFRALQGYDAESMERGVTHLITTERERFWPALGKVLEAIRIKSHGYRSGSKCAACGGSGWLETHPFLSNGMVYENVLIRCGSCGVPSPNAEESRGRRPLTAAEYRAWSMGELSRDYMPEGLKAKHPQAGNPDLKAAMAKLRIKLFGREDDTHAA
jgi:hypothetical protein